MKKKASVINTSLAEIRYDTMNNNNNLDDNTITTEASSFVLVSSDIPRDGHPLILSFLARHDTVGLDAVDPSTGKKFVTDHVCVNVKASDTTEGEEDDRAAVDIMVALDVSGSMQSGSKIELCKKTLETLVRFLLPQDRFGLVTYASDARIDLPLQRLTPQYKEKCFQTIRNLYTRGCTNISAALGLAAQEMRAVDSPNPVRSVFLLTDGHANSGIRDMEGLVRLTKNCLTQTSVQQQPIENLPIEPRAGTFMGFAIGTESNSNAETALSSARFTANPIIPISLHTFGYGKDHNSSLLQEMANATEGGTYYFVEDDKGVSAAFGDAIGGVVSVVAQNAVVTLHIPKNALNMGVAIDKVHHDQVIARENGSYTVTIGDMYAEETRDIVLTVKLAVPNDEATDAPIPHVTAKLCYTDTLQCSPVETTPVNVNISRPSGTTLSEENNHVAAQWMRVFSLQQMEEAEAYANVNNFTAARASLNVVHNLYQQQTPAVRAHAESASIFHSTTEMINDITLNQADYQSIGSKRTRQTLQSHRKQRASAMTPQATAFPIAGDAAPAKLSHISPYETKSKKAWRNKFA